MLIPGNLFNLNKNSKESVAFELQATPSLLPNSPILLKLCFFFVFFFFVFFFLSKSSQEVWGSLLPSHPRVQSGSSTPAAEDHNYWDLTILTPLMIGCRFHVKRGKPRKIGYAAPAQHPNPRTEMSLREVGCCPTRS